MTGKRYFKRMWEEEYYIFDSETISENEFDEKVEYEDYQAFSSSMTGDEVVEFLNELYEKNQQIKDLIHTMLAQIDVENVTSDSAIYSARIIFSRNEFNLIRELWKRS